MAERRPDDPPPLPVLVLGGDALLRQLVLRLLINRGMIAVDACPAVVLVVDPDVNDWPRAREHRAPIVSVVSGELADSHVLEAVIRGADGIVGSDRAGDHLEHVVHTVAAGGTLLHPLQVRALADAVRASLRSEVEQQPELSGRELDVLQSIDRGESVKQTARTLSISPKTVENVQSRLFRKLGARNRAQAIVRAHALGQLERRDA